jgi:hypothetical protein
MSYNVSHIDVVKSDLRIPAKNWRKALRLEMPELNPFDDAREDDAPNADGEYPVAFSWSGECSGTCWHNGTLNKFAKLTVGMVEAIVHWEGGDAVSGLRIENGEAREFDVEFKLVGKGFKIKVEK